MKHRGGFLTIVECEFDCQQLENQYTYMYMIIRIIEELHIIVHTI